MNKLALTLIAISLVGCGSIPMGDPKQDAMLKTFSVPADKAGVYIYRDDHHGYRQVMDVEIDGKPIGQTQGHTYLYKVVEPGQHTVTSKAENIHTIDIDTKPGTLTYIWQEVRWGTWKGRSKLHLVSEAEGQRDVLETNLAETK